MSIDSNFYEIVSKVSEILYYKALTVIPSDVVAKIKEAYGLEESELGKKVLSILLRNIEIAIRRNMLVCQDTGTPVYLIEVGDIDISLVKLRKSVIEGVRNATLKYHLRPNMVHPISRVNTGDNTGRNSPIIHIEVNEALGDKIRVMAIPKGSGSENMSALAMLRPADGLAGVKKFVLETVASAGGKGCPPYIVGVGIGGDFESVAYLAKKATIRPLGSRSRDPEVFKLERELFEAVNMLGLGPMGLGGRFTALAVNVEVGETHISSLPVAVNIQCWRGERAEAEIRSNGEVQYLG